MTRIAVVERRLPLDLPEPAAPPTGDVFDLRRPFTLPLNQAISKSNVTGSYTKLDRKLGATLAALAWDNLKTQAVHNADARAINALFREASGRIGNDTAQRIPALARSLSRLRSISKAMRKRASRRCSPWPRVTTPQAREVG